MTSKTNYYDKEYFDGGKGYTSYDYSSQYDKWADAIVETFHPVSVLEVGCAKGFLVKALRDRGVDAWGVDVSEYAINEACEGAKGFVFQHDVLSDKKIKLPKVDLVVSYDMFEHIPEAEIDKVRTFMEKYGSRFYNRVGVLSTPDWEHDASHINMHDIEWWQEWWPNSNWEESK